MADKDYEAIIDRAAAANVLVDHLGTYLRSGGTAGHLMDLRALGGYQLQANCLIRYTGRKSGKPYVTPLIYGALAGEVVLCGSKGGADSHPAWYLNLTANPQVEFQIATQAYRGTWREPEGEERARVWDFMVDTFPPYATYQSSTKRTLPLIMLKPTEAISAFSE